MVEFADVVQCVVESPPCRSRGSLCGGYFGQKVSPSFFTAVPEVAGVGGRLAAVAGVYELRLLCTCGQALGLALASELAAAVTCSVWSDAMANYVLHKCTQVELV